MKAMPSMITDLSLKIKLFSIENTFLNDNFKEVLTEASCLDSRLTDLSQVLEKAS